MILLNEKVTIFLLRSHIRLGVKFLVGILLEMLHSCFFALKTFYGVTLFYALDLLRVFKATLLAQLFILVVKRAELHPG